jgi:hypothetical protein
MRVIVVLALVLAITALSAIPPAAALFNVGFTGGPPNVGVPYVAYAGCPGFTFAEPFAQSTITLEAFNRSTLAQSATGALAIGFPATPFGGFGPTIGQTTSQSIAATDSYFYTDTFSSA